MDGLSRNEYYIENCDNWSASPQRQNYILTSPYQIRTHENVYEIIWNGNQIFHVHLQCICRYQQIQLKPYIIDRRDIRIFNRDGKFVNFMNLTVTNDWISFFAVVKTWQRKEDDYWEQQRFRKLPRICCIHIWQFSRKLWRYKWWKRTTFSSLYKIMEDRYQKQWDSRMRIDYCWNVKGERRTIRDNDKSFHYHVSFKNINFIFNLKYFYFDALFYLPCSWKLIWFE